MPHLSAAAAAGLPLTLHCCEGSEGCEVRQPHAQRSRILGFTHYSAGFGRLQLSLEQALELYPALRRISHGLPIILDNMVADAFKATVWDAHCQVPRL